jgi:hypothetical protein
MSLEKTMEIEVREKKRPDISQNPPALDSDGKPLFRVRDYILIERNTANGRWLDTKTYRVKKIKENGNLDLWDEDAQQFSVSNYLTGPTRYGYKFKFPLVTRNVENDVIENMINDDFNNSDKNKKNTDVFPKKSRKSKKQ